MGSTGGAPGGIHRWGQQAEPLEVSIVAVDLEMPPVSTVLMPRVPAAARHDETDLRLGRVVFPGLWKQTSGI